MGRAVISVAVKGYGIVLWEGGGEWRVFSATDSLSATLAARVEVALESLPLGSEDAAVREVLLAISGAHLLAETCDHGPGGCDHDLELN